MCNSKQIIRVLFLLLFLTSCGQKKNKPSGDLTSIDLQQIKKTDTLRVATMYGATSYFLYRDELMGYDYELIKNLAHDLKLNLKITLAKSENKMIQLLRERKVDIISYGTVQRQNLKDEFTFMVPQPDSYMVLVQNRQIQILSDVTELSGKTVYVKNKSIFHQRLQRLNDEIGGSINIAIANDSLSSEDLIDMVGEKKIEYTLAYRNMALLYKSYYPAIYCLMPVGFNQRNGWLVRNESKNLQKAIEIWQNKTETSLIQETLVDKYWRKSPFIAYRRIKVPKGAISPYDHLFKKYAPQIGWEWELLAALAFQESRFDAREISWAGAAGLMQLMPRTASNFGLNRNTVFDPEMNIEASVQYIKSLSMTFREVKSKEERIKFILAGYNTGPAHILDAMALAKKYGANPFIWYKNVEFYFLKEEEPKYYQDKIVKYGYFRGKKSVQYVTNTLNTYHKYSQRSK